ncbi:MAG: hypothetical protein ACFFC7_15115 [Candidatus Hermodarchaeota archaeon]
MVKPLDVLTPFDEVRCVIFMIKKVLPFFLLLAILVAISTQSSASSNIIESNHTFETSKSRFAGDVEITHWKMEFRYGDTFTDLENYLDSETGISRIHNATDFRFQATISNNLEDTSITLSAFTVLLFNYTPLLEIEFTKSFNPSRPDKIVLQPYESKTTVIERTVYFKNYNTYLANFNITWDSGALWLPENVTFTVDRPIPPQPDILIWMSAGLVGVILFMAIIGFLGGRRRKEEYEKLQGRDMG